MIAKPALSCLALGPVTGVGAFVLLAGDASHWRAPGHWGGRCWSAGSCSQGCRAEEVAWRGVVLAGLQPFVGPWPALGASSLAFAIWHWPSLRERCSVHLVTGAAFGGAFLAGGIAAAVLAHAFYNLLVDWAVHAERARLRGP